MSFNYELVRRSVILKREREGLNVSQAAAVTGIPVSSFHNFESGKFKPDMDTLAAFAAWAGLTLDSIMDGAELRPCPTAADTLAVIDAALASDEGLVLEEAAVLSGLMRAAYQKSRTRA